MTVVVQNLPEEAVLNSGSVRIAGLSDEDFIRIWDDKKRVVKKSKLEMFREVRAVRESGGCWCGCVCVWGGGGHREVNAAGFHDWVFVRSEQGVSCYGEYI